MLNKVILVGRLTRDPETRYLPSGVSVTNFTVAVDRNFTSQDGQRGADFIPIVTWRKLAELCANYLAKGRLVAISGRLQMRSYDGQDGQRRYVTEVVADEVQFLDRGSSAPAQGNVAAPDATGAVRETASTNEVDSSDMEGFYDLGSEDELPF
ncbi:single-stranded DNA-binding protein [Mahella australiensis]|uniref:Single-stranded DNA-binding protein n=1 Tax=Mahella australiensis (strain DSM 15567 / CIP 107919 / 50-1 BON) TaxID=697281 RepID=F3ZYJ8_MAHA5|nr:single-stranded DNA-binding protein [Mahella australiensis]AEE97766.1 single-strand binding protein [Mahella australiensis 50-1 BON]